MDRPHQADPDKGNIALKSMPSLFHKICSDSDPERFLSAATVLVMDYDNDTILSKCWECYNTPQYKRERLMRHLETCAEGEEIEKKISVNESPFVFARMLWDSVRCCLPVQLPAQYPDAKILVEEKFDVVFRAIDECDII